MTYQSLPYRLPMTATAALVLAFAIAGCSPSEPLKAVATSTAAASTDGAETYQSTRFSIDTGRDYASFISDYEAAVPKVDRSLIGPHLTWEEIKAKADMAAPNGFIIYAKITPGETMKLSGIGRDNSSSAVYLMGNHGIAETMYRHNPGVMLYAPLRVEIYESENHTAVFSIDRPSEQFGSFHNEDIAKVGHLLDEKVANLLTVLRVSVPTGLTQ